MLHFNNITLYRNDKVVLKGINLELKEQRIAIIGANGSGKSSLVRLINGLLIAAQGQVQVNGLNPAKEGKRVRSIVGFLFQNPEHQIIMPSVLDDVALTLKNQGISKPERMQRALEILQKMNVGHLSESSSHMLSGGEKQLVALAGILLGEPEVLVMDEPTALLDLKHFNDLKKRFEALQQQLIIVTHDMSLAAMCERVLVLDKGEIVYDGKQQEAILYYQKMMEN